jgi:capsid protein
MGKRGKRGGKGRNLTAAGGNPAGLPVVDVPQASGGWDGANISERRGFVWWPSLDTKKEMPRRTRREIIRRARWGDANVGFIRRCTTGVANLVGYLTPQSATEDTEWNKEAEAAFWRRAELPQAWDECGKLDFEAWQLALTQCRLRDGDNLTVLSENSDGRARTIFYESHQIDDGEQSDDEKPKNLVDGVHTDGMGRHIAYRLVDPADPTKWKRVEAQDAIFHAIWERPGRTRGVSAVAHAISNTLDIVEILADTKHAVKVAAQWGVALETMGNTSPGVSDELAAFLGVSGKQNSDGSQALALENILQGGRIQTLPGGSSLKTLQDTRPHPNQMTLLEFLIRDMAWGVGLASEVLWDISGLNGTATRYVMAETRRWVAMQQRVLRAACQRAWTWTLAKEIKAGRLREPKVERWWECRWIPQADMTIDAGRDGRLEIEMLEAGLTTLSESYGKRGMDWEEQVRQGEREKRRRREIQEEEGTAGMDAPEA